MQKLYVITPFKNNNSQNLYQTIKSISELKLKIKLVHLIIFDKSCEILINQINPYNAINISNKCYRKDHFLFQLES